MFFDFFKRYLFSQRAGALVKRISWLTIVGLGISITALILVISVMTALNRNIQRRTLAVEPHLTLDIPGIKSSALLEVHPLTSKLKSDPHLKVQVFESQDVIIRTMDGHFRGGVAKGLTQDSIDRMLRQLYRMDQESKKNNDPRPWTQELLGPNEVLIGVDLAVSMGIFEGDSIMVVPPESLLLPPGEAPKYDKVKVKKIITTSLTDVDSQTLFYARDQSLKRMQNSESRFLGIEVWTEDPNQADQYKALAEGFPEARIQTWQERNSALFLALRLEKTVITLFLGLAALIASFSMISVMVLLISQKRQEIGILRAIGMSDQAVMRLFFQIGLCLGAIGMGVGLFFGSGLSFWLEKFPLNVLPDIYYDSQIPAYLDFRFVSIVALSGVFIAITGSYYSSRRARVESPAIALKAKR